MITTHESAFYVMPTDANHLTPLIFGGAFFSKMDMCAAELVRRFLYESLECNGAVTHKAAVSFERPCYVGDYIRLFAKVTEAKKKHIKVYVEAKRELVKDAGVWPQSELEDIATADFVFVSIWNKQRTDEKPNMLTYLPHGLNYPPLIDQQKLVVIESLEPSPLRKVSDR